MRRFGSGLLWNTIAVAFNQGSTLVANLLLANLLGRSGFGGYAVALGTVQAAAQLASLGMGSTATRYVAEYRASNPARAERIIGFTICVAVLSAALTGALLSGGGDAIAAFIFHKPELAVPFRIAGVAVFFFVLNGYFIGALAGLERFDALGWANVLAGFLYVAISAIGGYFFGLKGAVIALAASGAAQTIILMLVFRRALRRSQLTPRRSGVAENKSIITRWVIPGFLGGFTSIGALWVLQALLARSPAGLPAVGVYGAAYNLMAVVLFLPSVANNVGMTLMNNLLGARDADQYRKMYWHNMGATLAVVSVGAILVALFGNLLLGLYGPSFASGYPALLWLLAACIPESLTIATSQVILAHQKIWRSILLINVPRDLAILGAAMVMIPSLGVLGAAIAYFVGRVVGFISTAALVGSLGLRLPASIDFAPKFQR
ncbi:MAG: oligosaccharide flippase family protein [Gemmatimonadaceae bacterium]